MRFLIGSIILAATAFSGPAFGQHPMVLSKLQEINAQAPQPSSDRLKQAVAETAKAFGEFNKACVPTQIALADPAPATGSRDVLQAVLSGQVRNAWTVYATYSGCPGSEPIRYLVIQKADNSLMAVQVNEGRTYTSPAIMRDTSMQAALGALQKARALDAGCDGKDLKMGPARIVEQSKDLGPDVYGARYVGSWSEVWRFETCGRKLDVRVDFTPDGDGGAYAIVKGDAVAVAP